MPVSTSSSPSLAVGGHFQFAQQRMQVLTNQFLIRPYLWWWRQYTHTRDTVVSDFGEPCRQPVSAMAAAGSMARNVKLSWKYSCTLSAL